MDDSHPECERDQNCGIYVHNGHCKHDCNLAPHATPTTVCPGCMWVLVQSPMTLVQPSMQLLPPYADIRAHSTSDATSTTHRLTVRPDIQCIWALIQPSRWLPPPYARRSMYTGAYSSFNLPCNSHDCICRCSPYCRSRLLVEKQ